MLRLLCLPAELWGRQPEHGPRVRSQLPQTEGLVHTIVCAGFERSHSVLFSVDCRQHNDFGAGSKLANLITPFQAVPRGYVHVQQDEIKRPFVDQLHRLFTVSNFRDGKSVGGKSSARRWSILQDKNAKPLGRLHCVDFNRSWVADASEAGDLLMAGVIQFALGGSVELQSRSRRGFARLARHGCSLASTPTSHWYSCLRIELPFRAARRPSRESSDDGMAFLPNRGKNATFRKQGDAARGVLCVANQRRAMTIHRVQCETPSSPLPRRDQIWARVDAATTGPWLSMTP
jgi:hypothetical protein